MPPVVPLFEELSGLQRPQDQRRNGDPTPRLRQAVRASSRACVITKPRPGVLPSTTSNKKVHEYTPTPARAPAGIYTD
jgi:hypothetical protein